MKTLRRNLRLETLAADLTELERRTAQQRIRTVIEAAKRRAMKSGRPELLKWYQVDFALESIGKGDSVPSIAQKLHCGQATLYQAIAATPSCRVHS